MADIDEYIAEFPKDVQIVLQKVRATIKAIAPDAEELISYKIPAFRYHGMLVYFAGFKNHIGLYPPVPSSLKDDAAKYAGPKGNLRFPLNEPIPYDLITKIVKERLRLTLKKTNSG